MTLYIIIGAVLLLIILTVPQEKEHGHTFTAEFITPGTFMSSFNFGFSLAGGSRATSRDIAFRNSLVVGPSGSGKTSSVIIGSIFTLARGNSSMVIMDVSGELLKLTSGYLERRRGYKVYCIDFGPSSDSFNCIGGLKTITEIQKVAFLLIKNSNIESKNDPFWSSSAEMLLSLFIEYLVFFAPVEFCNMANLVRLTDIFAGNPEKIDALFVKTRNQELVTKYKAMIAMSEKTLQSVLATVRTALKVFATPALRNCTATNTIDFSTFRKEKSVLYICTGLNDIGYYAPISALLFEAVFKEIFSRVPKKHELPIFSIIDEMASMRFQNLGLVFANCRKHRSGCIGVLQDLEMLKMSFSAGEVHAITSNSYSRVFLPGQPLKTCQELEAILGKYTYEDEKTKAEKTRQLATASEIRMFKEAIILVGNEPPIKAIPISYYNHWLLNGRTKITPFESTRQATTDCPLIQL